MDDMSTTPAARFRWAPIRKITLAALTAAVVYLAQRAGLDVGPDAVNDALQAALPVIVGYAVTDPRVKHAVDAIEVSPLAIQAERLAEAVAEASRRK